MKPLREEETPLGAFVRSGAPLEDEADAVELVRARARFFSEPRRVGPVPLVFAGLSAALLGGIVTAAVLSHTRAVPLEARHTSPDATWSWVGQTGAAASREGHSLVIGPGALLAQTTRPMSVTTPAGAIEVSSARFRLLVAGDGATSVVLEAGTLVIRRAGEADVRLEAPASWASAPEVASMEASFHRWALALERAGRREQALMVLEAVGQSNSVWAQLSLYDGARISVDLGQRERAQAFIVAFERQAPDGLLLDEMRVLKSKLGQ